MIIDIFNIVKRVGYCFNRCEGTLCMLSSVDSTGTFIPIYPTLYSEVSMYAYISDMLIINLQQQAL